MFVRFRKMSHRLAISLVETRRIAGKVHSEHVASLGSVEMPLPVADRIRFWQRLHERLARLGNRLDNEAPDKTVVCLDPLVCPCSTMSRIDPEHLAWVLEGLVEGEVRNRIVVDEETARSARLSLERMLAIV